MGKRHRERKPKTKDVLAITMPPYEMPKVTYEELKRIQDPKAKGRSVFPPTKEK